ALDGRGVAGLRGLRETIESRFRALRDRFQLDADAALAVREAQAPDDPRDARVPEVPVRPDRDVAGRDAVFGDRVRALRRDPSELAGAGLAEPQVAVGRGDDPEGPAVRRRERELRDRVRRVGRDPADLVARDLGEPEVPVGTDRDVAR